MVSSPQSLEKGNLRVFQRELKTSVSSDRSLYLFQGDVTNSKINRIVADTGITLPEKSPMLERQDFHLTIYHFNDLHGHLVRFSPAGEDPVISRIAGKVCSHRQRVLNAPDQAVITLAAGDDCIGSIFDELLGTNKNDFQVHASYALYSAMGVDAACLGNHDFDLGSDVLLRSIRANASFPILAANLHGCHELQELCFPAALLVVKGIRIGLIGVVTQAELKNGDPNCQVTHPIEAVNNLLPALKPLCDVVIIISHLGLSLVKATIPMINSGDVELAQSLPYGAVQLIVGGHSHHELNLQGLSPDNIVNGIPIVQAGSLGRFLGLVDMRVTERSSVVSNVRLMPTATLPLDPIFEKEHIQPLLEKARILFSRTLGEVGNDPDLSTEHVRSTFAAEESALANFIADGMVARMVHENQPVDLAMLDASSIRQGLRVGEEVTLGEWFNVMPFADTIKVYQLSGKQLRDLLQDNARRMDRPNEPHTERGFLHFSKQVRYKVVLGETRSEARAVDITINNQPIQSVLQQEFFVAGTSFMRVYAHSWEVLNNKYDACELIDLQGLNSVDTDLFLRRELVEYIQDQGGICARTGARLDGRLETVENFQLPVTQMSLMDFSDHVSKQQHAMAGAVIASSAAQAVALGLACVLISCQLSQLPSSTTVELRDDLEKIQDSLLKKVDQDAEAIRLLVEMRNDGHQLSGKELLCFLPAQIAQAAIDAGLLLQQFCELVHSNVRDDLEMSITLLDGSFTAAILLLQSNLRIWPDPYLIQTYQPQLEELDLKKNLLKPIKQIR